MISYIKSINSSRKRLLIVVIGIAINVILKYVMYRFNIPLYLDTVGTIAVAVVSGPLAAISTALLTSILCSFFVPSSAYYGILGILIGIFAAVFERKGIFRHVKGVAAFILISAVIGGIFGALLQWVLLGKPEFPIVEEAVGTLALPNDPSYFYIFVLVNFAIEIVDKAITTGLVLMAVHFIPEKTRQEIWDSRWLQKPLSKQEIKELFSGHEKGDGLLKKRITLMLTFTAILLALSMAVISVALHYVNQKKEYTQIAVGASSLAATAVDPDKVGDYMSLGPKAPGYNKTLDVLYTIRDNSPAVKYLYVIRIEKDGCYVVFDLEAEDTAALAPGDKIEFEEAFADYIPVLMSGGEIDPVESDDISGWVLTAYTPVKNDAGRTVCYACADVSMEYLSDYLKDYIIRALLIFSGFFILVIAYGLSISNMNMVYPINSMSACAHNFSAKDLDQKSLDEDVAMLRSLDIHTGDEVEKLYHALCSMAMNTAEQVRSIRYYAQANAKMQNGLIITMADMVENRDSDTGAHVQKTAAYVRIILHGLKRKGYYAEKLTEKYMSDVEMSAPLHDVGKINIPDGILNKPGKLDDKEYEIMKTHTTAGKRILENAISSLEGENYLKEARNMAAYHHERWDGKGYPEGLKGEVIPLSARVMAVADVFDALASPRVYKPAFPLEKALKIIEEGSGTQFDPKCVEVFFEALPEVKQVLRKYHGDII
ncbi:MAG: HD domain-containing protein [Lachnospiraceae bacterium]|nr:HD domain-containing protein [Lachnospiraceae bacterium]